MGHRYWATKGLEKKNYEFQGRSAKEKVLKLPTCTSNGKTVLKIGR
jgi:hypothetical protein